MTEQEQTQEQTLFFILNVKGEVWTFMIKELNYQRHMIALSQNCMLARTDWYYNTDLLHEITHYPVRFLAIRGTAFGVGNRPSWSQPCTLLSVCVPLSFTLLTSFSPFEVNSISPAPGCGRFSRCVAAIQFWSYTGTAVSGTVSRYELFSTFTASSSLFSLTSGNRRSRKMTFKSGLPDKTQTNPLLFFLWFCKHGISNPLLRVEWGQQKQSAASTPLTCTFNLDTWIQCKKKVHGICMFYKRTTSCTFLGKT